MEHRVPMWHLFAREGDGESVIVLALADWMGRPYWGALLAHQAGRASNGGPSPVVDEMLERVMSDMDRIDARLRQILVLNDLPNQMARTWYAEEPEDLYTRLLADNAAGRAMRSYFQPHPVGIRNISIESVHFPKLGRYDAAKLVPAQRPRTA